MDLKELNTEGPLGQVIPHILSGSTDLAAGTALGGVQDPPSHSPWRVLCSFFKPESHRGKTGGGIRRELLQTFPPFRTWKINPTGCPGCRIPSTRHPLRGGALRQGLKGSCWSSSVGPNCHYIPQSGTKQTPFKYFSCYILMNHLKGLPI